MMRLLSSLLPILLVAKLAAAADPLAAIAAEHARDTGAARETFAAALAKADQRAGAALVAAALAEQRAGDLASAAAAWREVLRFDREHAEARAFFTQAGTLDQVLAEVATRRPVPQPGALPTWLPANAKQVTIRAAPGGLVTIGAQRAGTVIMLQYVEGEWSLGAGRNAGKATSPDAVGTANELRLTIIEIGEEPPRVLAVVPAETRARAFAYRLEHDVRSLGLALQPAPARRQVGNAGEVVYQLGILPAAAMR